MEMFPAVSEVNELSRFLVVLSVIILFTGLFLWPLGWIFRQPKLAKKGEKLKSYSATFTIFRYFGMVVILMTLCSYFFLRGNSHLIDSFDFTSHFAQASGLRMMFLALPTLMIVFLPLQLIGMAVLWAKNDGTPVFRIHYALLLLAALVMFLFFVSWNLVVPGYFLSTLY